MPGENKDRRPRFPALVALAAFFSSLKNPFKWRRRTEETIPTKFEPAEGGRNSDRAASSEEVSRNTSSTRVSSGMALLKRIRHSIQGLRRGRVDASSSQNLVGSQPTYQEESVVDLRRRSVDSNDWVSQTLVQELKLDASSPTELAQQPTCKEVMPVDLRLGKVDPEEQVFQTSVHKLKLDHSSSNDLALQPSCQEETAAHVFKNEEYKPLPTKKNAFGHTKDDESIHVTKVTATRSDETIHQIPLDITTTHVDLVREKVRVPKVRLTASFDDIGSLSPFTPEYKADSKSENRLETNDAFEVPLNVETDIAMTQEEKTISSVETEVTVFDIRTLNVPTHSEEDLEVNSSVTTLISSRGSEYTTPAAGEEDSDWKPVEHSSVLSAYHTLSTNSTARSTQIQVPAAADCVLEDIESFDKEMKHFQENLSEINAFIHGSNDDIPLESKCEELITSDSANEGTSQGQSSSDSTEGTSNGLNSLELVKEGTRNEADSSGSSSHNSLGAQHLVTGHESTSNAYQSSSSSINVPRVVDASEIPLAYRRRLKLKQVLNDLPKDEEYIYNAVIAAEVAEADKVTVTDARVCAEAANQASTSNEGGTKDTTKSGTNECSSVAERIREAVEKIAKNLEKQVPPAPNEEKMLTEEQEEARQLRNEYGYPPPEELGPNPPEIKSFSQRRCQKVRERLESIQYEPCLHTDENWTDNLISGQRIKYETYTDSEHVIKIGYGSFGDVYLGMMDRTKLVVIKLFKAGKSDLESIAKEATITQLLAGTKCTPQYLGLIALPENETYVRLGIVLEYIGDNYLNAKYSRFYEIFRSEVRRISHGRRPYVPVRDWLKICYKLADGVRKIHDQGIIVNDLKLDNLLLNYDGHHYNPYVIDFGISRSVNDEDVYQIPILAEDWANFSEHYPHVAPEIYQGGHATLQSDIFSLGAILLTIDGIFHFKIHSIAKACRQTDPEKRPTAGELVTMLENALKSYHK